MASDTVMERSDAFVGRDLEASAPPPTFLSSDERLDEVARILALGILRLRARRKKPNEPNHLREFRLDFSAEQSVHGVEPTRGREDR